MKLLCTLWLLCAVCTSAFASEKELDMQCLREAYPHDVLGMEDAADGKIWLLLRGNSRVLYDVPVEEAGAYASLSLQATVRQSMAQPYPLEPLRPVPAEGEHPGRVRSYDFLQALFGASSVEVRQQLRAVPFAGGGVSFSVAGGAAEALARVNTALQECLRHEPQYRKWVLPLGGTFKWRKIAGENRLSPHSFGMAVDLNVKQGAYWRWSKGTYTAAQKTYPEVIVRIFEDNGFVWGGKWREFDLMHFEYRPEIICKARKVREALAFEPSKNELQAPEIPTREGGERRDG